MILSKATSLIVVLTALLARLTASPYDELSQHWTIAANLLIDSLAGAWLGADWATTLHSRTHRRSPGNQSLGPGRNSRTADGGAGWRRGTGRCLHRDRGRVDGCSRRGAADPEDRAAVRSRHQSRRSLSLMVSLPTMLVAFARSSRDQSFQILRADIGFVLVMAAGSITGPSSVGCCSASSPAPRSSRF